MKEEQEASTEMTTMMRRAIFSAILPDQQEILRMLEVACKARKDNLVSSTGLIINNYWMRLSKIS